jgi:hypothetical protein
MKGLFPNKTITHLKNKKMNDLSFSDDKEIKNNLLLFSFGRRSELYSYYYKSNKGLTLNSFELIISDHIIKTNFNNVGDNGFEQMDYFAEHILSKDFELAKICDIIISCSNNFDDFFDEIGQPINYLELSIIQHQKNNYKQFDFYEILVINEAFEDEPYRLFIRPEIEHENFIQLINLIKNNLDVSFSEISELFSALRTNLERYNFTIIPFHEIIINVNHGENLTLDLFHKNRLKG